MSILRALFVSILLSPQVWALQKLSTNLGPLYRDEIIKSILDESQQPKLVYRRYRIDMMVRAFLLDSNTADQYCK